MSYTREGAVEWLRQCEAGKHWITTVSCDSCWVNEHCCPPTLADARKLVGDAERLLDLLDWAERLPKLAERVLVPEREP